MKVVYRLKGFKQKLKLNDVKSVHYDNGILIIRFNWETTKRTIGKKGRNIVVEFRCY